MEPPIHPLLFSTSLFVGMLLLLEVGRQFSRRRVLHQVEDQHLGVIEGAMFALFGLLVAFTFSGAALRFQEKRMLISEEANAIGTAYLRVQLLPGEAQPGLHKLFRRYVDSRLDTYRKMPDIRAAELELANSKKLQDEIWNQAVTASRAKDSHPDAGKLLLPALNAMIDITTTRTMSLQAHPPVIIYVLLFALGLICSLLVGFRLAANKRRSWLHIFAFTLITVVVVYVILDIEYPRAGLIRLQAADRVMIDLRDGMK
jgi:hypothetical protein